MLCSADTRSIEIIVQTASPGSVAQHLLDGDNSRAGSALLCIAGSMTLAEPGADSKCPIFIAQGALTRLREVEHSSDAAFQAVALTAFNPKTVTLGGLYGEYHPQTHEWQDGLASCLIRAAVADTSPGYKWLVFDGPIDCGWIENLNTVGLGSLRQGSDHMSLMHSHFLCRAAS